MTLSSRLRMRHFRTFLTLCEHGTLTKSAEVLNTVQPALSRTLRELEKEIGAPLFLRTARGMSLTAEGETLRRHLVAGMAQIESGVLQAGAGHETGAVAIGMLPNVARTLVPAAVRRFKAAHPEVTVRLHWATVPLLVDLMRRGEVDLLASRLVSIEQLAGFLFEHLYDEPLVFAVRAGHPLDGAADVNLVDVDRFPVIVPLPGTIIRQELERFLFARGFGMFTNRIETVSHEFTRYYMQAEDVVVFVPEGSIRAELQDGRARRLDIGGEDLVGAVGLSYMADRELSPATRDLVQFMREAVTDISVT